MNDGSLALEDVLTMNFSPSEQAIFQLRVGDVLVTEGSGSLRQVGQSAVWLDQMDGVVCFQNTLLRLRPRVGLADARYLAWWARHAFASGLFASASTGANIFHLSAERLRTLPISLPSIVAQRAIAEYLDLETARIDAVIANKRRMAELLREQFAAILEDVIWSGAGHDTPLMHLTELRRPIMYGIVLPGPDLPDGVPIVKGGDVASRRLSPELLCRTSPQIEAPYARARLSPGDLVFAIRGGIGDVEIAPAGLAGANITQDVARIAPAPHIDPRWLRFALQSPSAQGQVAARTTGATIRGLNIWELKRIRLPASTDARRRRDTDRLVGAAHRFDGTMLYLAQQMRLLGERRQALITAAVTGRIMLPGVAA